MTTTMLNLGLSKDSDCGRPAMQSSLLTRQFLHDNVSHSVGNTDDIMPLCNGRSSITRWLQPLLVSKHWNILQDIAPSLATLPWVQFCAICKRENRLSDLPWLVCGPNDFSTRTGDSTSTNNVPDKCNLIVIFHMISAKNSPLNILPIITLLLCPLVVRVEQQVECVCKCV